MFKLQREMFIFQHCKVTSNHPPHKKWFCFSFESQRLLAGSFLAWQQVKSTASARATQACASRFSVCKQMNTQLLLWGTRRVLPNWDLPVNMANFFLVAITASKKLRLMEKNEDFYESDCVNGKKNQNNSQQKPDALSPSSWCFQRYK